MSSSSFLVATPTGPMRASSPLRPPNLLNVAVTRARRRLYVIGDRETWASEGYFDVLAAHVEQWHPVSQS